jgi:hypothetical protein
MFPRFLNLRTVWTLMLLSAWLTVGGERSAAEEPSKPSVVRHQVTGLFSKEREEDLRKVIAMLPEFKLASIDFDSAEIALEYDAAKVFSGASPEQIVERLDGMMRNASRNTFGVKPLTTIPREKLHRVEIGVVGLDCKACCLGAYEAIYRIEGVEQATASFRDGRVTAWIDPAKTDRAALEKALVQRNVELRDR